MASNGKIKGMDELIERMENFERIAPKQVKEELTKEGKQVISAYRKRVRTNAKIGKGQKHLHNAMKASDIKIDSAANFRVEIEAQAKKAPHYHLVEHGHKLSYAIRQGRGKKYKIIDTNQTVPGKHYFEDTMKDIEPKIMKQRDRWARKLWKEIEG